jgi:PAS domain S-box-containing protein
MSIHPEGVIHRILIVDDTPSVHRDFRKILCPEHSTRVAGATDLDEQILGEAPPDHQTGRFEVDTAFQGQVALEMVKQTIAENRPYALAFVDVRMPPGWDGIETISHLWEICPHLQVVICTAYSDYSWEDIRARFGEPDSLVVLKKPFANIEVQQLAHALTRKWDLNRQARMKLDELESKVAERTRELKRQTLLVAESEEKLRSVLDNAPDAVFIASPDGQYVYVNRAACALLEYAREELLSMGIPDITPPGEISFVQGALQRLQAEQQVRVEIQLKRRDGALVPVELNATRLPDGNVYGSCRDVTHRKRLEEQLRQVQKLEAIARLAGGVAHEFNNILAGALMSLELAQQSDDPTERSELLLGAQTASQRAAHLVKQLLAFGRRSVMQPQPLDLAGMVANLLPELRDRLGERIRLEFVHPHALPWIKADKTLLEQVLLNLCLNARDAMKAGGQLCLSLKAETVEEERAKRIPDARGGQFVRLSVSDTGCGMDARVLERLFEPFFTTKDVGQGTGLGLATVRGTIQQHQGWIEVESRVGEGSTFKVYLPVYEASRLVAPSAPGEPLTGGGTILLVEDEPVLRRLTRNVLARNGYNVLEAADASEALALWADHRSTIDLIFTDMVMPGDLSGLQLGQRAMAEKPGLRVIITSGYNTDQVDLESVVKAAIVYLPKPCPPGKLLEVIGKCLRPEKDHGKPGHATDRPSPV